MKKDRADNRKDHKKLVCGLLLAGSFFAALKCVFVSLQMDEEYALSMSYRMLLGDRMFTQIWDPHQTSGFLIAFLIWVYRGLFHGTSGVVIWVRLWGTLMHAAVAWRVYRAFRDRLSSEDSFLLGILYFNLLPKGYIMPEFSNMLVWSLTLLLLCLGQLDRKKDPAVAAEAGFWMCVMVLSYPSAVLLFPLVFWYLWKSEGRGKKRAGIFTGVCAVGAAAYLAYLFSYMTPAQLIQNVRYMLEGQSNHTGIGLTGKLMIYLRDLGLLCLIVAIHAILTLLILSIVKHRRRSGEKYRALDAGQRHFLAACLILALGVLWQAVHWALSLWRFEMSYIYSIYFILFGIVFLFGKKLPDEARKTAGLWIGCSALMFAAVLILTNLTLFTSVRYVLPGVVAGLAAMFAYADRAGSPACRKCVSTLVIFWCFTAIFVKGWEYRDNEGEMKNITCVRGIVSEGPSKGIFTEYMQSYMQRASYEEIQRYVRPGDRFFVLDRGSLSYFAQDVEIASYTTICDPRYNEVLLKYWEQNPRKYPDVIAVQCWYGELKWDSDSWIMRWIEEEFDAQQVVDGKYFRYYIKKID